MSSDFKPLPQGEAGYDVLRASPFILVRYRSDDAADTDIGICFGIKPRNRTTTDDMLNELRDATDRLIGAAEGNGEDLVSKLEMSGDTCVCALAGPNATSHQPTLH
jgi:hypothetical protein